MAPPQREDQAASAPPHPSPPPRQASVVERPAPRSHRPDGASDDGATPRARRASSPPGKRPSRLRESSRLDSQASFPSISETTSRQTADSSARRSTGASPNPPPAAAKKHRARPPNLAGPAPVQRIRAIPDTLYRENDRTDGSGSSAHGSYVGSSGGSGGGSGGEDSQKDGGRGSGERPLFAMGGVFPRHAPKRRRSSLAKEWQREQDERDSRGRKWRAELPTQREGYASSTALNTASSTGTGSGERPSADFRERGDPFEEIQRRVSKLERAASRHSHASSHNLHDDHPRRGSSAQHGVEDEAQERPHESHDLKKHDSGSSATVAEEPEHEHEHAHEHEHGLQEGKMQVGGPLNDGGDRAAKEDKVHRGDTLSDPSDMGGFSSEGDGDDFSEPEEDSTPHRTKDWPQNGGENPTVGGQLDQDKTQWEEDFDQGPPIRNWWGTLRYALREPLAEFLGTMVLVIIGIGSDCQTKVSQNSMGAYSSMNWAWGFGVMIAIYIAGGISGGHTNPAVTIVLALFRGFPWKLVPRYLIAQIAGGFAGALIIYGNYKRAINEYDPVKLITATQNSNASATLFITAPATQVGNTAEGFCQEILASGVLTIAVLALGDENNAPPGAGLGAIVLGFVVVAIGMSNGWISGYAINIARDLGPRLALWCVGYGTKLWTHDDYWWLAGAIAGPIVGSVAGAAAYDICIFTGPGSPINYNAHELSDALGVSSMHNMVRMVFQPSYRRKRRSAKRTQNPDDLAESGMAPAALERARTGTPHHPGRMSQEKLDDLTLQRRWRRGKEKVVREEEQARRMREREQAEWRRSIEELREREQERAAPEEEGQGNVEEQAQEIRRTKSAIP
ncbi:hypothetical protein JCM10207_007340 [Rhodosporidiobolus poonsookiae]